ncbi:MAG: hypothetical protein JNM70_03535 [Anaerolineae bacterium]|nr:hypothetical protein [Anaerolineae bacterium]
MVMSMDEQTARAMLVQTKYTDYLLSKPNVMGVAVGLAQKEGQYTNEVCLVVMVSEKCPLDDLTTEDRIPPELDGVRVDVQVIGIPTAL